MHKRKPQLQTVAAQFLLGITGLALITLVCFWVGFHITRTAFAYLVLIALVSLLGSFTVSVVLSLVAVACLNYFFAPPLFDFRADDPEDIVKSVKRGVYAKRFSGGQVNISNGDFVFALTESYLIEDGKLTAPLKGVNLIGNGPDVLRKVTMLGNDFELSQGTWTCG